MIGINFQSGEIREVSVGIEATLAGQALAELAAPAVNSEMLMEHGAVAPPKGAKAGPSSAEQSAAPRTAVKRNRYRTTRRK